MCIVVLNRNKAFRNIGCSTMQLNLILKECAMLCCCFFYMLLYVIFFAMSFSLWEFCKHLRIRAWMKFLVFIFRHIGPLLVLFLVVT